MAAGAEANAASTAHWSEAGRREVSRAHGVIVDPVVHDRVLSELARQRRATTVRDAALEAAG